MPGRPRKPTALHVLSGHKRSKIKSILEARAGELTLTPGNIGPAPDWLILEARAEWDRLTGDPEYSRVLAPAHRGTLLHYCALYGRMVAWARGQGSFSSTERQMFQSLTIHLGLTPSSQSKVKAPPAASESPRDPWQQFAN